MKKLLVSALFLVAAAGSASAAGLNLSWTDCGITGTENRNVACTANTGSSVLVGSFVAPTGLATVTGFAAIVDVETATPTLPAWWDIGGCRLGTSMVHSASFLSFATCFDYFAGGAGGSGVYLRPGHPEVTELNRARIKEGWALPAGSGGIGPIDVDTETYAFNITITNARSVGLGACAGCLTETCIVFNEILVTNAPGDPNGNTTMINPALRAFVTFQGWSGTGENACYAVTPVRNRTWGSVKSLYR